MHGHSHNAALRLGALVVILSLIATADLFAQNRPYPSSQHGGNYMFNYYLPPAPSSTPWAPAWSPNGEAIAVSMQGSIWKIAPATGVADELTYNRKYHSSPDWSPDGRWIVYTTDDGGTTIQLEILNVETGKSRALTGDGFLYSDPTFSPDGRWLAYVSNKPNGYFNVYVRPIDNGNWSGEEVAVTTDHRYQNSRLYFGPWDMHITPAWMPNGDEVLLVSNRNVPLGSGNVVRVPAIANGIDHAQTVLAEQTLYRTQPDVSHDGKRFVYSSSRGAADQFNNLYVQPTQSGEPYKLTFFSHDAFQPRWSPDGEWIAYISNAGGLPHLALLETYGGTQKTIQITERHWSRPVGTLSVRVHDAETGDTIGARIHLTASDGKFYAPAESYARVSGVGDHIFHTTGTFEVVLPPGEVGLVAVKGFEFRPESTAVAVRPNETTAVDLHIERMTDLSANGWFSGSTHVHMNYAGNLHNTLNNLMMMSVAEDQDVVNELVANKDNRILDYQFFVAGGGPAPVSRPDRLVVVGQEYRPPFYGHVFMLGLREHLISPFTTGYEGTAIESLYPSNTDMLRKAKAQGATVGYVHPFFGNTDPLAGTLGGGKGFMVDAALGTTDALEWSNANRASFHPLYAVWNNGLLVTAVGGEDSISDLHRSKLVGSVRTYVCTGDRGLDMEAWFDNLRAGHAFVSTGPLVHLIVNGKMAGEIVALPAGGDAVQIEATVRSITPLEHVVLVFNGDVLNEIPLTGDRKTLSFRKTIEITRSGWFHLRAEGNAAERFPLDTRYAQAFTNPVWITVAGQPIRDRDAAEYGVRWIDKLKEMADARPGWRSRAEREHVYQQFEAARSVYLRLADEAEGSGPAPTTARHEETSFSDRCAIP